MKKINNISKKSLNKNKKVRKKSNSGVFLILICIATLFMSIAYAQINSINLNIDGTVLAIAQDGIFITDVVYASNTNAEPTESSILSYHQTLLGSNIKLSNEKSSSITYTVTIHNSTDFDQYFTEIIYDEGYYDNADIVYELNGLEFADKLKVDGDITFNITFKYDDSVTTITNNILNSYIKFSFVSSETVARVTLTNGEEYVRHLVELTDARTTFTDSNLLVGVALRCNNGAVPTVSNGTLTVTNIVAETECDVFDGLEETIETADTTLNNILMIGNETVTFSNSNSISVAANKNMNLDINGKTINVNTSGATANYINNNGIFNIYDSKGTGYIQSDYRIFSNQGKGVFTMDSVTCKRTATDYVGGGIIVNFAGKVVLTNSTFTSEKTSAFLSYGNDASVSLIDNCTFISNSGDTVINASADGEISISNSTITSSSGAAFKGAYELTTSTDMCGPIYICNSTLSGNYDYYSIGLGKLYYTPNVTFLQGTNTPISNDNSNVVKNFINATDNEWYKVKTTNSSGEVVEAKYPDGNNIRVGDKINICTLLDANYVIDVVSGQFVDNQNVQIYTSANVAAQEFTLLASVLDNYYNIVPYSSPTMSCRVNDTNIELYINSDTTDARFKLTDYDVTEGNYYISSPSSMYFDVKGDAAANAQNLQAATFDGTDAQKWQIKRTD